MQLLTKPVLKGFDKRWFLSFNDCKWLWHPNFNTWSFKKISFSWQFSFYKYIFFIRHNLPFSISIWNMKIIWKWVKWKYAANMLDHSRSTIRNLNSGLHIALWWFMLLQLLEAEERKFPLSFLLYLWLVFSLVLPEFLMKVTEISRCFFNEEC